MAEAFFDALEAIEIDQDDSDAIAGLAGRTTQAMFQPLHEIMSIRQAGQGVVEACLVELLLEFLALLYFFGQSPGGLLQLLSAFVALRAGACCLVSHLVGQNGSRQGEDPGQCAMQEQR